MFEIGYSVTFVLDLSLYEIEVLFYLVDAFNQTLIRLQVIRACYLGLSEESHCLTQLTDQQEYAPGINQRTGTIMSNFEMNNS